MVILQTFWLLLPAGLANTAPVILKKLNILNYPIDFGARLKGRRILGANKTFRGLVGGIMVSILTVYIQSLLYPFTAKIALINYSTVNILLLGFLLGFGALAGDLIESSLKRRIDITPGQPWIPFDQVDWILGTLFFANFYIHTGWLINCLAVLIFVPLHFLVKWLGYLAKLNQTKL